MRAKYACKTVFLALTLLLNVIPAMATAQDDVVLKALQTELNRSFTKLKTAGSAPLYFLSYRVYDVQSYDITAEYGALKTDTPDSHKRTLDVELRVGSPKLDNTHLSRSGRSGGNPFDFLSSQLSMPLDDDEAAIRSYVWEKTDSAYKGAESAYSKALTNRDVKIAEEDNSDDFSKEKASVYMGPPVPFDVDVHGWEERVRKLSAIYNNYPDIKDSSVHFSATKTKRYVVTTEGTKIEDETVEYRIYTTAEASADDGMRVWLYDGSEARSMADIPSQAKLEQMIKKLATSLIALRIAKPAEPYAGPAILQAKSAGVFFHEIFGHRIEGHRQKNETEGHTFTKLVGQQVMPSFITVVDDPTLQKLGPKSLNGYFRYDEEGVPAQKVVLVDKGTLRNFLMGRSPIKGFPVSNGHGRGSPGLPPVARQGNLIVSSSKTVPYAELRKLLIEEVKRQKKPYGLVFDELAGGFTTTQTFMPQVFKLKPLRVWRVFPDGRPDELLRGVDLVGTPLASLERILVAGDDPDVFNGTCGAESGNVPVSAASPSLLVQTIEVERNYKEQNKPPILPPPDHDKGDTKSSQSSDSSKAENADHTSDHDQKKEKAQ